MIALPLCVRRAFCVCVRLESPVTRCLRQPLSLSLSLTVVCLCLSYMVCVVPVDESSRWGRALNARGFHGLGEHPKLDTSR